MTDQSASNLPEPSKDAGVPYRPGSSLPLTAGQERIDFVDVRPDSVDPALARIMDVSTCGKLRIIPLAHDATSVVIAMADASNLVLIDDLRARFAPREVTIVTADETAIQQVVTRWTVMLSKEAEADAVAGLDTATGQPLLGDGTETGDDGKVARVVARLLDQAVTAGASDVHLEPVEARLVVRFRIDGVLVKHDDYPLAIAPAIINRLKVMASMEIGERRKPQDGKFNRTLANREVDCRLVTLPTAGGYEEAVVRLLDQSRSRMSLTDIGFSPAVIKPFEEALRLPHGMILVTGPTGSGKTTTLFAGLSRVADVTKKVLTVEDPVEIRFPGVTQVQVNERADLTFAETLRSFLRADPDIILVGEIRDSQTAALAAQAALTGHLVLSTLHTNEASGAPTRLQDMGLAGYVTASALKAVLSQRLLRRLCERCKVQYEPSSAELEQVHWGTSALPHPERLWRPSGRACEHCHSRGYHGRVAAAELLVVNNAVAEAIAQGAPSLEIERITREGGQPSMHADALAWAAAGTTSLAEIRRVIA